MARTHTVEVTGVGGMLVQEVQGPPGAPTVLLIHGVGMTAGLNWRASFPALGRHFSVVAPDLRGHGGSLAGPCYSLEQCADDVAALAGTLGVDRCVVVGYSMGGLIAQALWRRHRHLTSGLVLCSTSTGPATLLERLGLFGLWPLAAACRWLPRMARPHAEAACEVLLAPVPLGYWGRWARQEMRRTPLDTVASAAQAVGAFDSGPRVTEIDVPTAVLVTERDRVVPPSQQRRLAAGIPGAAVVPVDAGHGACLNETRVFVPRLVDAALMVAGLMPGLDTVPDPAVSGEAA